MSTVTAAQYTAHRLKALAERQVKSLEPRRRQMPIRPSEARRRFLAGEERWRVDAGLVTPEQYQRYMEEMQKHLMGG